MKPEWMLKIKEEVVKLLKAGFIKAVSQTDWVANIVPVPKETKRLECAWISKI
jgi:hypothetical protein